MKQILNRYIISLFVSLVACLPVVSQTVLKPVSYSQYMQMVVSDNLDYAAQKLNVDIAQAQIIAAKVRNDPELGFSYFNNEQAKKKMGYGGSLSLSQTFTFGKRTAAIGLAKSERELSAALLADYLRNLRADAAISFYEALKQKKLYEIKQSAYKNIYDLARADSIRFAKGKIMEIDAIQSRVEAGLSYNELLQSETERDKSYTQLSLYTGSKTNSSIYQPESELKLSYRQFRLADLIEQGKMQRADLTAAMQNIDVANKALKVARREKNSDVTLSLEVGHNAEVKNEIAPAPSFNNVTAGVSFPLPVSKMNKGSINAAKHRILQANLQYEQAELTVQNEIMRAYYQYESTAKQVAHFESGLLKQAGDVLKGKIYSYTRGDTSLLEVLNAQRTYNDVQSQYYEAVFNFDSALVELERSAGIWNLN